MTDSRGRESFRVTGSPNGKGDPGAPSELTRLHSSFERNRGAGSSYHLSIESIGCTRPRGYPL